MAMSAHSTPVPKTMHWITPKPLIDALGEFDLDPCAHVAMPWKTAKRMLTIRDDGLTAGWNGRVWLNPPYGSEIGLWMERMARHGRGVALIFARTETDFWHRWIWPYTTGILFLKGRIHFHFPDGTRAKANSGAPSVLVAYSHTDALALQESGLAGKFVAVSQ
jgi:hypothetical protein